VRNAAVAALRARSTCAMRSPRCSRRAAAKVGLYTSPHLNDIRERIQSMAMILHSDFARIVRTIEPAAARIGLSCRLYFRCTPPPFATAEQHASDIAIIETPLVWRPTAPT